MHEAPNNLWDNEVYISIDEKYIVIRFDAFPLFKFTSVTVYGYIHRQYKIPWLRVHMCQVSKRNSVFLKYTVINIT